MSLCALKVFYLLNLFLVYYKKKFHKWWHLTPLAHNSLFAQRFCLSVMSRFGSSVKRFLSLRRAQFQHIQKLKLAYLDSQMTRSVRIWSYGNTRKNWQNLPSKVTAVSFVLRLIRVKQEWPFTLFGNILEIIQVRSFSFPFIFFIFFSGEM